MRSGSVSSAAAVALLYTLLAALPGGAAASRLAFPGRLVRTGYPDAAAFAAREPQGAGVPGDSAGDGAKSDPDRSAPAAPSSGVARSPRKALLLSLLLPGAGELYQGHRGRATGFFVAEGAVWANFVAWEVSGHLRRNDYIEQAQLGAGIGVDSGSDDYWRLVGQYQSSSGTGAGAYEETLRREARNQYPDDPAAQDQYVAQRLPTGARAWSWSTADGQALYQKTRQNANRAFDRAKYSIGFAILNRLVSALDTQILHRSTHADEEGRADWNETRILTAWTADGGGALLIQRRF